MTEEPVTEAQLLDLAKRYRDYLEAQRDLAGPITYTNRAARRAQARARQTRKDHPMTYQSKAALREANIELQWRLNCAEEHLDIRASQKGVEDFGSGERNEAVVTVATQVVLELVLKALEIPGYDAPCNPSGYYTGGYDTARFRTDLETALRVRTEKVKAAEDAATEARVAGLAKKDSASFASGGYVSGSSYGSSYGSAGSSYYGTPRMTTLSEDAISKLASALIKPQSETVEKTTKKSKGDKK